jgi:hypothetical protein
MSKRSENWTASLSASATLDWCQRIVGKFLRFAGRIADQLRMAGKEKRFEVGRIMSHSHPVQVDLAGKRVELREFVRILNIGDRIRVFCDDGVLVAEKVSQTQLRIIQAERIAEGVH